VIEKIEKKAGKKLNNREKKKAIEVIKIKKKIIKMKKIDPDDLDGNKEEEPEVSVDDKGKVSLKPKETLEDKIEAAKPKEELKPTPVAPIVTPPPAAAKAGPPVA